MSPYLREIVDKLMKIDDPTKKDLEQNKFMVSRKYGLEGLPQNSDILRVLTNDERCKLLPILRRKETRALSGINVVAVMTEPYSCPHGRCAYCPGGPDEDSPQSYTGHEPAAMRGTQNQYDGFMQVQSRIKQLRAIGHTVDKVDLIIMGGTFPATPKDYQAEFVKRCLDGLTGIHSSSLMEAKKRAESEGIRNVGLTVETRPDCLSKEEVDWLLNLGVTRVEIGVQNVYNEIYKIVNRGHSVKHVINGTSIMKDSALKVCYHMMPGLPGSSMEKDLEGFKQIFENQNFRPDMLKIYPTLVVKGTKLYEWWKDGEYDPLSTNDAVELIAKVKEITPPWIRIMRIQRDIPLHQIEAGVEKSNLRQLIKRNLAKKGKTCHCIRCREVGHSINNIDEINPDELGLVHRKYSASDGIEEFISVEDESKEILVGFVRLRIPSDNPHRPEISNQTGLIRELHVYGRMTPVGLRREDTWQHKGWGEALMNRAEKTALEKYGMKRIIVMSALGTREYYHKIGYKNDGVYVSRDLI